MNGSDAFGSSKTFEFMQTDRVKNYMPISSDHKNESYGTGKAISIFCSANLEARDILA